jgi:hypothetical protein
MSSYPTVFSASIGDLGSTLRAFRETICALPEPRIYAAAFVLATNFNLGLISWWTDWNEPVPTPVKLPPIRRMTEDAMWLAFGFPSDSVLRPASAPLAALGDPPRVMIDPFFDAQRPDLITVVRPGAPKQNNAVKVPVDHPAWLWNPSGPADSLGNSVEYQTGNTFNQQNGVKCALPAIVAIAAGKPAATYAVVRGNCPNLGPDAICALNASKCASDGDGGLRASSKPRVLIPASPDSDLLLTPSAFEELVDRARMDKESGDRLNLPRAKDFALMTGWAAQGTGIALTFGRIVSLIGPLLSVLSEP